MHNTPMWKKFDPDKVFWLSDTHGFHKNLVRGTSQWEDKSRCVDFDTVEEYNDTVIKSINDKVSWDSILFFLGDFVLCETRKIPEFRERINCQTIHFHYGNHDRLIRISPELQKLFTSVQDYSEIYVKSPSGNRQINLFHYPMKVWNNSHKFTILTSGHSHGSLPYEDYELGIDCGWSIHEGPLSFWEIEDLMKKKKWKQKDHHGPKTQ